MSELEGIRLQKVLASAGLGSRRKCEEFITAGRVTVNGEVVDELGSRVNPDVDVIHVDGVRIAQASGHIVVALNKPRGVVTSMHDEQGRECVGDLVAQYPHRLFHVGRLDADTEGLLLLTNDGELSQRLSHPSHGIVKTYFARVQGKVSKETIARIKAGVEIEGTPVAVTDCLMLDTAQNMSVVEISIHEGRNRILRKLFEELGHPVIDLVRTQIGPVKLGNLRSGYLRELTNKELGNLYNAVGL
jgi:23S rRNA pseudouridine2605 synthase